MIDTIDGLSMNIEHTNMDKLKAVFPECFAEGKLDIDKLLSLCGEYIDNDFEKYKFEWNGKSECLKLAQKRSAGTLRPCPEESVNFDTTQNLYIEGDNLEVLKLLQTAYYRKVKMIYIDPPYNTGNDFVYADDFADPIARYKEVTQQTTKSNPETMGRFHTNWLNMMYPRLRLAANLLRDDGVIFISIDDNEASNLRKVCDEVFGEENFVAQITTVGNPRGRDYGGVARMHDYLLVYRKTQSASLNLVADSGNEFKMFDNYGGFELRELRNRNIKFNKENRPNLYYPFYINPNDVDENGLHTISVEPVDGWIELYPLESQGINTVWRWGKPKSIANLNVNIKAKPMKNGGYMIVEKYRESRIMARSVWWDKDTNTEKGTLLVKDIMEGKVFDYPKPVEMIMRMLEMGTDIDEDSLVLDFFSGSATTAHSVMQLNAEDGGNRKFICVQIPELCDEKSEAYKAGYKNICEIGKERIRRAGAKILAEMNENDQQLELGEEEKPLPDIGFKVFKLDTSNLKTWDSAPVSEDDMQVLLDRMNGMIHRVKNDRSDDDMIYEIALKMGIPLTAEVEKIDINGKTAYTVGKDCLLLVCLAENIQPEDVDTMAEYAPAKVIIARDSFADDTAMSNAYYILRDRGIELKLV